MTTLSPLLNPIVLYLACGLGGVGVALAMPKKKVAPFVVGAIVCAVAFGLVMIGLAKAAGSWNIGGKGILPNGFFYIFSIIALGSALRVITHQRPIYSALYFILTILSSTGLYLLLQAEFMAFALVIVYAGAILITYMFVIMLATEGPNEMAVEAANSYDRVAREPVVATFAGFLMLAALTTMIGGGVNSLRSSYPARGDEIALMTGRVESALREAKLMSEGEHVVPAKKADVAMLEHATGTIKIADAAGKERILTRDQWPAGLQLSNAEGIGMSLIADNPGSIEIAGVILLMAMVGAVVLARKKVEMDEHAKAIAAKRAREDDELGREAAFVPPLTGGNN